MNVEKKDILTTGNTMGTRRKILIVDDDNSVRESITDILKELDFIPIAAATGNDALHKIGVDIDVALIDLRLEDMSGVNVLKEIKKCSPKTECILVTGFASQESAIDAINLGAYSYILKPYDIQNLQLTIHRAIEKRRTEDELRESEKKFRELYNNSPDMYVSVSPVDGTILVCNDTFLTRTGYTREEAIGAPVFTMYHEDCQEEAQQVFDQFKTSEIVQNRELILKTKNGSKIDVSLNIYAVRDQKGIIQHSMSAWRDITELKQSQRKQKALREQIQQAKKMEAVGTLAGGIAHDFNNILSSIIGFTELALGDTAKGSEQEDNLKEVYIAGQRAKKRVQQILAFARLSDQETVPVDPSRVITNTLELLRPSTPANIEIRNKNESSLWILGNESQLQQIIMNLCTNSIQAMQKNGGTIEIGLTTLQADNALKAQYSNLDRDEYVKLTVVDNGPGIDESIIQNIFEPYFTTKNIGDGTGMGLSMVKGIVENFSGYLNVTSKPSQQTTFTILLPVSDPDEESLLPQKNSSEEGNEHILFIDDEAPITRLGKRILESLGYTATVKTNSSDALKLFKTKSHQFDLVISDMTMSHMNGEDLAIELRKIRDSIPIILCTESSSKISDERIKSIGIDGFLYKPFSKKDFSKVIRDVIEKKRLSQGNENRLCNKE